MNIIDNIVYLGRVLSGRILSKNIPLILSVSITGNCNFRCSFCYGGFGKGKKAGDLSTDEWIRILDEAASMGAKVVQILGGEPLLRDDLGEIVDRIKKRKMIVSINTNGSLVEKRLDVLRKFDSITVSLDGSREANDKNRGKGTYDLIWNGINCLKKNNLPFSVVGVITKNNIHELKEMLETARKNDFSVEFNLPYITAGKKDGVTSLSAGEIKDALKLINGYKDLGYPLSLSNRAREYAADWPVDYSEGILYGDMPKGFKHLPCYMGRFICYIEHDGSVLPCSQLAGRFPAINAAKEGFKKAWENLLPERRCKTCYNLCYNEMNLLHDMDFTVLSNTSLRKWKQMRGIRSVHKPKKG